MIANALCIDNNLSLDPQQLLINKAVCPENKNEPSGGALYHSMHIKGVWQCLPSSTFTFKGGVENTFMWLFYLMSTTGSIRRGFLEQHQVERFTNEYSDTVGT